MGGAVGSSFPFVRSFRIDYERDENWRLYHPYGDSQVVSTCMNRVVSTYTDCVFAYTPCRYCNDRGNLHISETHADN